MQVRMEIRRFRNAGPPPAGVMGLRAIAFIAVGIVSGCVFETQHKGPDILFMGNSITLNAPAPAFHWTGNWGMAATAPDSDYVHQTVRILKEKGMEAVGTVAARRCPDCDGALDEQIHNMDQVREMRPRFVVVQLSEHSGDVELRSGKMTAQYRMLLQGLKDAGVPHAYCVSAWGEKSADQPHAEAINQALKEFPAYEFVDITAVAADTLNYGDSTLFKDPAVQWHPGNRGMRKIAEAVADAIWADR
ncbi:MAG: hypothetical protein JWP91_1456 [Fibrobacteres bacterium]|nr:hypothetical protein [Fibrobacterota bacterium]